MRNLLSALNIDEDEFVRRANRLFMDDYTDFDEKIVSLMEKMSRKKGLMDVYGHIENDYMFNFKLKILNKRR
jgi:hypothetical protein